MPCCVLGKRTNGAKLRFRGSSSRVCDGRHAPVYPGLRTHASGFDGLEQLICVARRGFLAALPVIERSAPDSQGQLPYSRRYAYKKTMCAVSASGMPLYR